MTTEIRDIAIVGGGGLGKETAVLIHQINEQKKTWNLVGFFDDGLKTSEHVLSYPLLGGLKELNQLDRSIHAIVAIGDPSIRKQVVQRITNPRILFPVLVHPSAVIGLNVQVGEGSVVTAGCRLTVDIEIGKHVLLNLNTTVGHDVVLGNFSSVMPGVHLSGYVKVGESVLIGTGASLLQHVHIGSNSIVGAGAVVNRSVKDDITVAGVPARSIFKK